jgi:hypothetical protein
MSRTVLLPYSIPYYAQVASPGMAEDIFVHGLDPVKDPRWAESGADSPEEYAYWVERACGVACLKMCVEALDGPEISLVEWARRGLQRGGYLIRQTEDGRMHEVGWVHSALARMAQEQGLQAEARPANLQELVSLLEAGWLVVASVSYEAGDDHLQITHKGGHLMVVFGAVVEGTDPQFFLVNNPSGRRAELQAGASLPAARFEEAFSGRVIVFRAGS